MEGQRACYVMLHSGHYNVDGVKQGHFGVAQLNLLDKGHQSGK